MKINEVEEKDEFIKEKHTITETGHQIIMCLKISVAKIIR